MANDTCSASCQSGPELNTIQKQISYAIEQGKRILEGGLGWNTFKKHCENLRAIMVEFFKLPVAPDQRILKLQEETKSVIAVTKKMQDKVTLSRSIENFIMTCEDIDKRLEQQLKIYERPNTLEHRLQNLNEHISDIGKMTESFQDHGVVMADANKFLQSCKKINTELDKCVSKIQNEEKKEDEIYNADQQRLIEFLKRQLSGVEIMTQDMTSEGVASRSLEDFLNACQDFRAKLEGKSQLHQNTQVEKLIIQLEETIQLSNVAKESGFASKNVDNFINYCQKIRDKLVQHHVEPSSSSGLSSKQVDAIKNLENNINTILDVITKMKIKGQFSESLQDFVTTCYQIKKALKVEKDVSNIPVFDIDKYMDDATCSKSCNCPAIKDSAKPAPIDIASKISSYTSGYKPIEPISVSSKDPVCVSCFKDQLLGLHETREKKIVTLKRFRDKTGMMNEQTDTVIVRESSYDPTASFMPDDVEDDDGKTIKSIEIESYINSTPSVSFTGGCHFDANKTVGYIIAGNVNEFKEARKAKSMVIFKAISPKEPSERRCISYLNLFKGENLSSLMNISTESQLCHVVSLDKQRSSMELIPK